MLPCVKEAIGLAGWAGSPLDDWQVTYFIMGWESEGTFDAAMEFKHLRLQVVIEE